MQIIDRGGVLTVKLTGVEGRRLRDAAYITRRIARNLNEEQVGQRLSAAADVLLEVAELFTAPAVAEKQDALDQQTPPVKG